MELTVGLWNNASLAQWFQIKEDTFKHAKRKKLEELKKYCDFEEKRGKVNILNVKIAEYVDKKSRVYGFIVNNMGRVWNKNNVDTIKNVNNKLFVELKPEIKEITMYGYSLEARDEIYGKPNGEGGTMGGCIYEWCNNSEEEGIRSLTDEERIIYKKYLNVYFGDAAEKTTFIQEEINSGRLTRQEAWKAYDDLMELDKNFKAFIGALREYGIYLVKATRRYCTEEEFEEARRIKEDGFNWS